MHPEVVADAPGRCPKCGMALVPAGQEGDHSAPSTEDRGLGPISWRNYLPLLVAVGMIVASAAAASWGHYRATGSFSFPGFLLHFMAGFFLVFAGFKLMDLKGFAEGYATYDLIASRLRWYGYAYPFIELGFGLLMLAGYHPNWLLWTEFAVMAVSGIGVAIKVAKGERFQCACLGTFLKVPLTSVTLVEDFGMAALALVLLALGNPGA